MAIGTILRCQFRATQDTESNGGARKRPASATQLRDVPNWVALFCMRLASWITLGGPPSRPMAIRRPLEIASVAKRTTVRACPATAKPTGNSKGFRLADVMGAAHQSFPARPVSCGCFLGAGRRGWPAAAALVARQPFIRLSAIKLRRLRFSGSGEARNQPGAQRAPVLAGSTARRSHKDSVFDLASGNWSAPLCWNRWPAPNPLWPRK